MNPLTPLQWGHMASKVLIANRGEIACRVINTAKRMGLKTVAVYCDAEMNGKHVHMADEAYRLGPPPASSSYLLKDKIIEIAKQAKAQAIHPGYGFLSENAEFAHLCAANDLEFIGPPASAISSMGSKSESKRIMIAAGVPVIPGYQGDNQEPAFLQQHAEQIGFPVLIKAAAGGGGRGMRLVRNSEEFPAMLEAAKREAIKYFADDEVILEKFIERSRHVEVQVFADKHGNCVYLFERDCSIQRRHQKILEEAPAPLLSDATRRRIGEVAVAAAKAVNYVGAGTVEFLYDARTDEFYFMEMNTRLQVEHPVTEAISGVDLVELQIRVASGEPLPFRQEDLVLKGHAIEARIYAEDTSLGFLPGSGRLKVVQLPESNAQGQPFFEYKSGAMVRVDSGFREGDEVLMYYDSMISKLIVWAADRQTALLHMHRALEQYKVVGVPTNIDFLKAVISHPDYADPKHLTTDFIQDHQQTLLQTRPLTPLDFAMGFFAVISEEAQWGLNSRVSDLLGAFRVNLEAEVSVEFQGDKDTKVVGIPLNQSRWLIKDKAAGWEMEVQCTLQPKSLIIFVAGQRHTVSYYVTSEEVHLLKPTGQVVLRRVPLPEEFSEIDAHHGAGTWLLAPMPGKVVRILKMTGETVQRGDTVAILEAMKMEHAMKATIDGIVEVVVKEGDMVDRRQHVAVIDPTEATKVG